MHREGSTRVHDSRQGFPISFSVLQINQMMYDKDHAVQADIISSFIRTIHLYSYELKESLIRNKILDLLQSDNTNIILGVAR